jgi:hypothetical protein
MQDSVLGCMLTWFEHFCVEINASKPRGTAKLLNSVALYMKIHLKYVRATKTDFISRELIPNA